LLIQLRINAQLGSAVRYDSIRRARAFRGLIG
jgi:hypothetical protein